MKLGVLSDTHIQDNTTAQRLSEMLLTGPFAEVDAILHAGDAVIPELESYFYPLPFYAVRGNMDHQLADLPISRRLRFADKTIGLVHGWGGREGIEDRVLSAFHGEDLDALVFGHSHWPICRMDDSVLLFNPGSATDKRNAAEHTVGVLTLTSKIIGEIIPINW